MLNAALGCFTADVANVGDDLNNWLWPRLFGAEFNPKADTLFIGIGSILDNRFQAGPFARKIVFGAGARTETSVPHLDASWEIRFVRGPGTAAALGGTVRWIADPALLIALAFQKQTDAGRIGVVPYFRSNADLWDEIGRQSGLTIISPKLAVNDFIRQVASCRRVFAESMHGAIIADALRIPWRPISAFNRRHEGDTHIFKWTDWCRSMELAFEPLTLPAIRPRAPLRDRRPTVKARVLSAAYAAIAAQATLTLRAALRHDRFTLSRDDIFTMRLDALQEEVASMRPRLAPNERRVS